jgi:S1-C subfamily serine protease
MGDTMGVLVVNVRQGSTAADFLQANDVILSLNARRTDKVRDLFEARMTIIGSSTEIVIFRNQKELKRRIELKIL